MGEINYGNKPGNERQYRCQEKSQGGALIMVSKKSVFTQLKDIGVSTNSWGSAEIHELPHILVPGEKVTNLVNGWYENGFATLVATSHRLLLIDKKLFNLTLEDIRYDMIAEVDFRNRLLDSTVVINTINKKLTFTSIRQGRLRHLTTYIQHKVMELRQNYSWAQYEETPMQQQPKSQAIQSYFVSSADTPAEDPEPSPAAQAPQPDRSSYRPYSPYAKPSLTTKHITFLPKIPKRLRPDVS